MCVLLYLQLLLYPGQWHVGDMTGPVATLDEIVAALNHAVELTIRAVYYNNVPGVSETDSENDLCNQDCHSVSAVVLRVENL